MQDEFRLVNDSGVFPKGAFVFERVRPAQVQNSECHDKTAEPQAMFDTSLLLTLPVTVPQNTLFPLISLRPVGKAPLRAINCQITCEW